MESISYMIMKFPTHENPLLISISLTLVGMVLHGTFLEIIYNILRNISITQKFSTSNSK